MDYYATAENARKVFEQYESAQGGVSDLFSEAFPKKGKVLDIGAGSGRDMSRLALLGHDVDGIEPSSALRQLATQKRPELANHLFPGSLPKLDEQFKGQYDGIVCSAVLMHLPLKEVAPSLQSMAQVLKPHGQLLLCIPNKRPGLDMHYREPNGRLFSPIQKEWLIRLADQQGLSLIKTFQQDQDTLGRAGVAWQTLLLQKRA